MEDDLAKAVKILEKPERLFEDLEFLIYYLNQFEELKNHFNHLNSVVQTSLCRQFTVKTCKKKEILFNQNDPPNNFYLILSGTIGLYDGKKFVSKLPQGKTIGEREITKNLTLPYTGLVYTLSATILVLQKEDFLNYLGDALAKEVAEKTSYLKMLIPNMHKLPASVLEKLIQGIKVVNYYKGEIISHKGTISEHLLLLVSGECSLVDNTGLYTKELVRIVKGSTYGEESIFYSMPVDNTLQAKTDVSVAFIRKSDILTSFPEQVLRTLKNNLECKKIRRSSQHSPECKNDDSSFPLASTYAKKKLAAIVSRSNRLSPSRLLDYHQKLYGDFKEMLTEMRNSSPNRVAIPTLRRSQDFDRMGFSFS